MSFGIIEQKKDTMGHVRIPMWISRNVCLPVYNSQRAFFGCVTRVLSCTNHLVAIWSQICDTAVNGLIKSALVDPLLLKYTNNQRKELLRELKRNFSGQSRTHLRVLAEGLISSKYYLIIFQSRALFATAAVSNVCRPQTGGDQSSSGVPPYPPMFPRWGWCQLRPQCVSWRETRGG